MTPPPPPPPPKPLHSVGLDLTGHNDLEINDDFSILRLNGRCELLSAGLSKQIKEQYNGDCDRTNGVAIGCPFCMDPSQSTDVKHNGLIMHFNSDMSKIYREHRDSWLCSVAPGSTVLLNKAMDTVTLNDGTTDTVCFDYLLGEPGYIEYDPNPPPASSCVTVQCPGHSLDILIHPDGHSTSVIAHPVDITGKLGILTGWDKIEVKDGNEMIEIHLDKEDANDLRKSFFRAPGVQPTHCDYCAWESGFATLNRSEGDYCVHLDRTGRSVMSWHRICEFAGWHPDAHLSSYVMTADQQTITRRPDGAVAHCMDPDTLIGPWDGVTRYNNRFESNAETVKVICENGSWFEYCTHEWGSRPIRRWNIDNRIHRWVVDDNKAKEKCCICMEEFTDHAWTLPCHHNRCDMEVRQEEPSSDGTQATVLSEPFRAYGHLYCDDCLLNHFSTATGQMYNKCAICRKDIGDFQKHNFPL